MKSVWLAAAVFACSAAQAAPAISGKYIVTERRMCQATATFNFANGGSIGNYVNNVNLFGGDTGQTLLLATFSPAKGTISVTGFGAGGDTMLFHLTGTGSGTLGSALTEHPENGNKIPYSNTDTTVTINGLTYHVFYGQVDKNNVAHFAAFQGVYQNDIGQACTNQGEITRQ